MSNLVTTAADQLNLSRLRPTQLELLGDDVDLSAFYLTFKGLGIDIQEAVETITVSRTIEGASTVAVTVNDHDRILLRSGKLSNGLDTEIDGLYFRLVQVSIADAGILVLTFEDREISLLRLYKTVIKATLLTSRTVITRAQFIDRLIREVKEVKIPTVIPQLDVSQPVGKLPVKVDPITRQTNRATGIPAQNNLTVKGVKMSENQRNVAEIILDTASQREESREAMVISMMVAIDESSLTNLTGGDADSVGVFQQRASQGWPASRDVIQDSTAFFDALDKLLPSSKQYYELAQDVQRSGDPSGSNYAAFRTEAERIVTTYGLPGTSVEQANAQKVSSNGAGSADYEFYRGVPPSTNHSAWKPEDSWTCITRLASEVNYRAFFVSGTFYYISDRELFQSLPIATLDESSDGVIAITSGDYDENKKNAQLDIEVQMSRWAAPPGSIIQIQNMGPWDGRWIVNEVERVLSSPFGTITLKKPLPRLPEPTGSNLGFEDNSAGGWTGSSNLFDPGTPGTSKDVRANTSGKLIQPIPLNQSNPPGHSAIHETEGLPGYLASDFFADYKTAVLAVENGVIVKLSGHDPSISPLDILGAHGPYAWSMYLLGDSGTEYYYTHLATRNFTVGQRVIIGQEIATVANYALYGTPSHTHVGVHPGSSGHPDINDLIAASQAALGKLT